MNDAGPASPDQAHTVGTASAAETVQQRTHPKIVVGTVATLEDIAQLCPLGNYCVLEPPADLNGRSHELLARTLLDTPRFNLVCHRHDTYGSNTGGKRSVTECYAYAQLV